MSVFSLPPVLICPRTFGFTYRPRSSDPSPEDEASRGQQGETAFDSCEVVRDRRVPSTKWSTSNCALSQIVWGATFLLLNHVQLSKTTSTTNRGGENWKECEDTHVWNMFGPAYLHSTPMHHVCKSPFLFKRPTSASYEMRGGRWDVPGLLVTVTERCLKIERCLQAKTVLLSRLLGSNRMIKQIISIMDHFYLKNQLRPFQDWNLKRT